MFVKAFILFIIYVSVCACVYLQVLKYQQNKNYIINYNMYRKYLKLSSKIPTLLKHTKTTKKFLS